MEIKKSLVTAINKQINHELNNAHIYHALEIYFERCNMHGFAAWMKKQVGDERTHAEKFIAHLVDRGAEVDLGALSAPKMTFPGVLAAFKTAYDLERKTTKLIEDIYALAVKEQDFAAQSLLKWFIDEQVEEEQWTAEIVELIEDIGEDHRGGIYMLDHRWGKKEG